MSILRGVNVKVLVITIIVMVAVVGVLGFLTSGFTSTDLTTNPEGAVLGVEKLQEFEGWSFHGVNGKDGSDGYDAYRVVCMYDEALMDSYEEQGYKVEAGVIIGDGLDLTTGVRYNSGSKLTVVEKDGALVSGTDRAEVYLFYSSDESVETLGWWEQYAHLDDTQVCGRVDKNFETAITPTNPIKTSLVARMFVRLTSKNGSVKVYYQDCCEVLSVDPLVFGER